MLLTAVLAYLHVVSAISWLGGGILFTFVVGPRLARMPPASTRDFLVTVVPGIARFFQVVAGLTLLFGFLLMFDMVGGDYSQFSTSWGIAISIGLSIALVAFVISEAFAGPAFLRLAAAAEKITPGTPPDPGFPTRVRYASMLGLTVTVLLIATLSFMIAAGFY